jgi:hypothetical protein
METVAELTPIISPFCGDGGTCAPEVALQYINSGRRILWNKGDTDATTGYYCVCCPGSCFTMPSEFKRVMVAYLGNMPISLGNEWYQSIPQVGILNERDNCTRKMIDIGGYHVTFQNYTQGVYQWALQAENAEDTGVEITIKALNTYKTAVDETKKLKAPSQMVKSKNNYTGVLQVVKPRTAGRVRLYAIDPLNGNKMLMAVYQPYDVNPWFKKFKILGCKGCLTIKAKKKFFYLTSVNDLVEFEADAMISAISAIVNRENKGADAIQQFGANLSIAQAEVNRETADEEEDVGSPMRVFCPDNVDSINPGASFGYGWWGGGGPWGF